MKLTKREQILVIILAFVLLWSVSLSVFIIPEYIKSGKLKSNILELSNKEEDMKRQIELLPTWQEKLTELQEQMEAEQFFYREFDTEKFDRDMQSMAVKHQVSIYSFEILENDKGETKEDLSENAKEVQCVLGIKGSAESIMNFIDEINTTEKSIVLTNMDVGNIVQKNESGNIEEAGLSGTVTISIFYMEPQQ